MLSTALIITTAPFLKGDTLTTYGDVGQVVVPVAAGTISVLKSDMDGLLQFGATWLVSMGTTFALKSLVDSERPNGLNESFPSGHATSAFSSASFLHYRYGWEFGLPAYAVAGVVGYSRVEADEHHWEDVIAAAVIANVWAYVLTDTLNENVSIVPLTDWRKKNFGVIAKLRF